jgi:hypothetical protein
LPNLFGTVEPRRGAVRTRDEYVATATAKVHSDLAATLVIEHREALAAHETIKSVVPISDRYLVKRFRARLKSSLEAWPLSHRDRSFTASYHVVCCSSGRSEA